jgi:hypothetical protein
MGITNMKAISTCAEKSEGVLGSKSVGDDSRKITETANPPLFSSRRLLSKDIVAEPLADVSSPLPNRTVGKERLLGQVLYHAALLSREMSYLAEKEMIRDCLYQIPPLHPRRPLGQQGISSMSNSCRIRDQVLYPATAPPQYHLFHAKHKLHAMQKGDP